MPIYSNYAQIASLGGVAGVVSANTAIVRNAANNGYEWAPIARTDAANKFLAAQRILAGLTVGGDLAPLDQLNVYGGGLVLSDLSSTTHRARGSQTVAAIDNTDTTRKYRVVHSVYDTAAREYMRANATGSAAEVQFLGGDVLIGPVNAGASARLHLASDAVNTGCVYSARGDDRGPTLLFRKARDTINLPGNVLLNDVLLKLQASGWMSTEADSGAGLGWGVAGAITIEVDDNPVNTFSPASRICFKTNKNSILPTDKLQINSDGNVGINSFGGITGYGGGLGVLGILNAAAAPAFNPTNGIVKYAQGGAGKVRTPTGNIVTYAPNSPTEVTGSRGGNAALTSLITALAAFGYISDATS